MPEAVATSLTGMATDTRSYMQFKMMDAKEKRDERLAQQRTKPADVEEEQAIAARRRKVKHLAEIRKENPEWPNAMIKELYPELGPLIEIQEKYGQAAASADDNSSST